MTIDTTREGVYSGQNADELRGALIDQIIARHELLGLALPGEIEAALRTSSTASSTPSSAMTGPT